VRDYVPSARPGERAPHHWLAKDGVEISTLDLFTTGFCLLAGAKAAFWKSAAQDIGADKNIPITAYVIGFQGDLQDPTGGWALDEILRL
jgi:2,4-dichlorophenol 6-monooxygenase